MTDYMIKLKSGAANYKRIKPYLLGADHNDGHFKYTSEGYEDLVVENLGYGDTWGNPIYSITHCYEQNGDLMSDPDMMISVNDRLGWVMPLSFQNDSIGLYQQVFTADGKRYILDGARDIGFLRELGISDANGRIHDKKQAKFRQINRFLEIVRDVEDKLPTDRPAVIYDLCCGKSYLTFAVYYYFTVIKKREVHMWGVDLKQDVIDYFNYVSPRFDAISTAVNENPEAFEQEFIDGMISIAEGMIAYRDTLSSDVELTEEETLDMLEQLQLVDEWVTALEEG